MKRLKRTIHLSSLLTLSLILLLGCRSEADPTQSTEDATAAETEQRTPAPGRDGLSSDGDVDVPPNADTVMIGGRRAIVWASSELDPQGGNSYGAANAFDGDPSTAWVEGTDGLGEGESLFIQFDRPTAISGMGLIPGYMKSSSTFEANAAPKEVTINLGGYKLSPVLITHWETMIWEDSSPQGCYRAANEESLTSKQWWIPFTMSVEASQIQIHVTRVSKGRQFEDMAISEVAFLPVESSYRSLNKIFDGFRSKDYEAIVSSSTRTEDLSQKFYHFRLGGEPVKFTAKPDAVYSRSELSSMISSTRSRPGFPYFARIAGEKRTHATSNEHSFFNHVRDSFIGSSVVFFERDSQQFLIGSRSFQYGTSEWLESYPALEISRDGKIDRGWEINRPGAVPGCEHVLPHPDSIASYSGMQPPLSPF